MSDDVMNFAPGVLEKLARMEREDPKAAEGFREMLSSMRQAHSAWKEGKYNSFEEAMEAISGIKPVEEDDED